LMDHEHIWSKILDEASPSTCRTQLGSAIFFGEYQCGKSSLVARMIGSEKASSPYSSVLEYNYLPVHFDDDKSSAHLPVWILGGDESLAGLLEYSFPQRLSRCVLVLCASLAEPWKILPTLDKWYKIAEDQVRRFYTEDDIQTAETGQTKGASIVVVLTKSDKTAGLSAEALARLQYQVRKFCLSHGAALIYTSSKEGDESAQTLRKYLTHRVYGVPFSETVRIVDTTDVFIPAGWDSEVKLELERETIPQPDRPLIPYDEGPSELSKEPPVECDEEEDFLAQLTRELANDPAESPRKEAQQQSAMSAFFDRIRETNDAKQG